MSVTEYPEVLTLIDSLCVGVLPEEPLYVRVNDTFLISCSVELANGNLNFYDGDEMMPNEDIRVRTLRNDAKFDLIYIFIFIAS